MDSPQPSFMGRTHFKKYLVRRNFFPLFFLFSILFCHCAFVGHHEISRWPRDQAILTIFTSVKGNDSPELRIRLMFLENDADVDHWIQIEEKYLKYLLPNGQPSTQN